MEMFTKRYCKTFANIANEMFTPVNENVSNY